MLKIDQTKHKPPPWIATENNIRNVFSQFYIILFPQPVLENTKIKRKMQEQIIKRLTVILSTS